MSHFCTKTSLIKRKGAEGCSFARHYCPLKSIAGGNNMKNKITLKLAACVSLLACIFLCAAGILVACNKPQIKPHDVEIVLINPHTGEPMARKEYIAEPPAGTPIEVKIKDLVTGEYLTDSDLPETTLDNSISIGIDRYLDWDYNASATVQNRNNTWPNRAEIETFYKIFEISVGFDCRPRNPENPREFQRKYKMMSMSFMFEYV